MFIPPSVMYIIKPFQHMLKLKCHQHFNSLSTCRNDDFFLIFAKFAECQKCFRQKFCSSLYSLRASCSWQCIAVDCTANVLMIRTASTFKVLWPPTDANVYWQRPLCSHCAQRMKTVGISKISALQCASLWCHCQEKGSLSALHLPWNPDIF